LIRKLIQYFSQVYMLFRLTVERDSERLTSIRTLRTHTHTPTSSSLRAGSHSRPQPADCEKRKNNGRRGTGGENEITSQTSFAFI